jgi:hypothetical protein
MRLKGAAFIIYLLEFLRTSDFMRLWVFCVGGFLLISVSDKTIPLSNKNDRVFHSSWSAFLHYYQRWFTQVCKDSLRYSLLF